MLPIASCGFLLVLLKYLHEHRFEKFLFTCYLNNELNVYSIPCQSSFSIYAFFGWLLKAMLRLQTIHLYIFNMFVFRSTSS
jgi:hypothetical protein